MMKNDYLWDKKGGDAEIEGLENLLSGFKYEPTAPPRLAAAVAVNGSQRMPWWKFSLAFAVPACLLFVVAFGLWATRQGIEQQETGAWVSPASSTTVREERPVNINPGEENTKENDAPANLKTVYVPKRVENPRPLRAKYRETRKSQIETLTAEEKFAYDQLKLALSITGSKLKVVSDTVNRAEE